MGAAVNDIELQQGASFIQTLTIKDSLGVPIDLTGETYAGQIRSTSGAIIVWATFTCTVQNQITNTGEVIISLTPTQTAQIPVPVGIVKKTPRYILEGQYDIERTKVGGVVDRILEGKASISGEVTI